MGTRDDAGDAALDGGPPDGTTDGAAVDPFLTGAWEPVHDELDVDDLPVTGEIPDALAGSYVRNGPNPALAPEGRYHVFDGDGMLHAVRFEGGRACYRNRWIESAGLTAERRAGRPLFGGLAEVEHLPGAPVRRCGARSASCPATSPRWSAPSEPPARRTAEREPGRGAHRRSGNMAPCRHR